MKAPIYNFLLRWLAPYALSFVGPTGACPCFCFPFPFGVLGRMYNLILSVPYIFIYFC